MSDRFEVNLHDWVVYAYEFWGEQGRLVLHTELGSQNVSKFTDLEFEGVVGHYSRYVLEGNILYDVREVEPGELVEQWKDFLDESIKYGFPGALTLKGGVHTLAEQLIQAGLRCFEVSASYGMYGFVIATSCRAVVRPSRSTPPPS